jgi:hypothetical protein
MDLPVQASPLKAETQKRYSSRQSCTLDLRLGIPDTRKSVMDTVGSIMADSEADGCKGG